MRRYLTLSPLQLQISTSQKRLKFFTRSFSEDKPKPENVRNALVKRWNVSWDIKYLDMIETLNSKDILGVFLKLKLPGLRTKFVLPRSTFYLSYPYFGRAYGREEALKNALALIYRRWRIYTKREEKQETDLQRRQYNRLMGTLSCPGGGKTFFLDCLSHLKDVLSEEEFTRLFEEVVSNEDIGEFKQWFMRVIFLPISFNGATILDKLANAPWDFEFAVRLCYAYLSETCTAYDFLKFRSEFSARFRSLEGKSTIAIILENMYKNEIESGNNDPCFMLLIDQISEIADETK